VYAFTA